MEKMKSFFFKQKTAYEMRISDWSSDVCSSDLADRFISARFRWIATASRATWAPGRAWFAAANGAARKKTTAPRTAEATTGSARTRLSGRCFLPRREIGRASCRERVCQSVLISVVAGTLKKKNLTHDDKA